MKRQLQLLHIPRSSYYYKPRKRRRSLEGEARERAMRVVEDVHLEMPYAGARKIRVELRERTGGEVDVTRHCVSGLTEEMNVRPLYPKPSLSKPAKKALRHPCLLKNKAILFPNQVWGMDITYVPIGRCQVILLRTNKTKLIEDGIYIRVRIKFRNQ